MRATLLSLCGLAAANLLGSDTTQQAVLIPDGGFQSSAVGSGPGRRAITADRQFGNREVHARRDDRLPIDCRA